jgi:hypothetical protein
MIDGHSRQEVVDSDGLKRIHKEIKQLRNDIEEEVNDGNEAAEKELRGKLESLLEQVRLMTYMGKPHDLNSCWNRWRPAINGTLNTAYSKLREDGLAPLAEHFCNCIHSEGKAYVYRPVPPLNWQFAKNSSQ